MGFFRVVTGKNSLGIEGNVAWATPKAWTEPDLHAYDQVYVDPAVEFQATTTTNSHLRKGN